MTAIPDSHRDLLSAQVGTLGTIGPDGRPQLSEVWFLAEGDSVSISLNTSRQKTKNLRANPAVSFLTLTLFIALFERDYEEPLAFQREYATRLSHWDLPYPDIST